MCPLSTFDNSTAVISFEPENSYSPSPNTKKAPLNPEPSRTVTFSQTIIIRETIHVNNYSDDEIDACWYNDYEFEMMRDFSSAAATQILSSIPPLSTFDKNNTAVMSFEPPEHSYSPSPNEKKTPAKPEPRRTVAFSHTVSVRKTMHVDNYSDDEFDACWYNNYEFDMMRKKVRYAAKLLQNGMLEQDTADKCCPRGVEHLLRKVALKRIRKRVAARDAVLEEQELQWEEGICEPEYIARVYKVTSVSSQASAHAIALKDELDAICCNY
jgi:hypothetical protein